MVNTTSVEMIHSVTESISMCTKVPYAVICSLNQRTVRVFWVWILSQPIRQQIRQ